MKKRKIYGKLVLDLILLVLLALEYKKQALGMQYHELGGLFLCGLFLIHKLLNWQWIRSVSVGIVKGKAKINARWIVDILLFVSMTAVLITGLLISKTLPTSISNGFKVKAWHYFFAAVSLVLSGIHLGLHGALLRNHVWNKIPLSHTVRRAVGICLLCVVFCLGCYNFVVSGFVSQFTRPFASTTGFPDRNMAEFGEMNRDGVPEKNMDFDNAKGSFPANGEGMEYGKGDGDWEGQNRPDRGPGGISVKNVISTFVTYASIFCGFAVTTAVVNHVVSGKSKKGKSVSSME